MNSRIHARPAFPPRFPAKSPQVLLPPNVQILPLCFDNDMNCSPRKPFALITIQIALPCTPSAIPPSSFSITYELPRETPETRNCAAPTALHFPWSAHPGLAAWASLCRACGAGLRAGYRVGVRKLQHEPYRQSWLRRSNLRRSRRFLRHVAPLLTLAVRAANASPATKTESGRKKYLCEI